MGKKPKGIRPGRPGAGPNKRNPKQREADLAMIEQWYVCGKSERKIVELLAAIRPYRLSRQQVHYDLVDLDKRWKAEQLATRDAYKRRELQGLQEQEDLCWIAFKKSQQDLVKKSAETTGPKDDKKGVGISKQKVQTEEQCGDPRFMELILSIRQQRIRLLGLDEPIKLLNEHSGIEGAPIKHEVNFIDDAVSRIYNDDSGEGAGSPVPAGG